ncbi:MAG: TIGR03905 family TSCPD domain-containing protein [Ruminiclostridium sp.]|nr:TIGR03905 family TSCPD domain-containing protein [Ruminiclostridium sp.]
MEYKYKTRSVCSTEIRFDLDGEVVTNVAFTGGCNGNLKAVSKLVDGMTVSEIEKKLGGNTCGNRPTSCADQLAKAVRQAYDESNTVIRSIGDAR